MDNELNFAPVQLRACGEGGSRHDLVYMLEEDWRQTPVYMMDFEGSPVSGVVEYGVVELQGGGITGTRTALCRPTGSIPQRDRAVHGISVREAGMKAFFSERYGLFVALRRGGIFAAHNRHAENRFLKDTWPLPPAVPDWRVAEGTAQEWGPWIDTLSLYRRLYRGLEAYGLTELVDGFGLRETLLELAQGHCPPGRARPHCALFDALASSLLLLRLEEEPELKDRMTRGWLLELSGGEQVQAELF
ncbi:MAG TPA: hypothetical protein VJ960_01725 [Oceanipulchritudo sp.]|nr:hypothetical protein [Oceanipulchritudo sp.]